MEKPKGNRVRRSRTVVVTGGLGLLIVTLGVLVATAAQPLMLSVPAYGASPVPFTETPPPASTPPATATLGYLDGLRATAVAIAATLPTATPLPGWPPDKASGFQQEDLMKRAFATASVLDPTPPGYRIPYPPTLAVPTPTVWAQPAGAGVIYDDVSEGMFPHQLQIANYWVEVLGDEHLIVCAGRKYVREDPLQGEVLVGTVNTVTHGVVGTPQMYLTPGRHGLVRIVDGVGERLTLRAEDGTLFYFDVPSRQWVSP